MAINQRIKKVAMTICNVKMWRTAGAFGMLDVQDSGRHFPQNDHTEAIKKKRVWQLLCGGQWAPGSWPAAPNSTVLKLLTEWHTRHHTEHITTVTAWTLTALDPDTCHTVEAEHPRSKNPNVPGSLWGPAWCWCCTWTTFDLPSKECRPQMLWKITFEYM